MSKEVVTGLNILKKGQDPPLRPDDQLPDWLWQLAGTALVLGGCLPLHSWRSHVCPQQQLTSSVCVSPLP